MSLATFNKIIRFKKMKIENISKFIYNILKYNFISFDKKKNEIFIKVNMNKRFLFNSYQRILYFILTYNQSL